MAFPDTTSHGDRPAKKQTDPLIIMEYRSMGGKGTGVQTKELLYGSRSAGLHSLISSRY